MINPKLFGSGEAKELKTEQNDMGTSWRNLQCSGCSQVPSENNLDDSHRFLSLYSFDRNTLYIYNTNNQLKEEKILDNKLYPGSSSSYTQLPNGELFCYGDGYDYTKALIIDKNYRVRMLPPGIPCHYSSALYFENNIYCFGGKTLSMGMAEFLPLSRKFDLKKNRWIDLVRLPDKASHCHSVILNRNILISSYRSRSLWLYSIEINSFSRIACGFASRVEKILINVGKLYMIEWGIEEYNIYEGEDEYCFWKRISKTLISLCGSPKYCLYNKGKIYITTGSRYYQFDLRDKKIVKFL